MKVNQFFTLAFAALAMLASCSSEMDAPAAADGESIVSFTATLPGGMGRSFGDGKTATRLQYAVYGSDGKLLSNLSKTTTISGLSKTVEIPLVNGKKYKVVFWASSEDSPYTFNAGETTATVTAAYDNTVSSDENLDAFYATKEVTVSGTEPIDVTLKRPFAQLNIGTNDVSTAENAGFTNEKVAVTVTAVKTQFDLLNGKAIGDDTDVKFNYGARPTSETFPVDGYSYLAMNYILVGSESTTANVTLDVENSGTATYTEVPLKPNYRTNIYGALLTSGSKYNVTIDPEFEPNVVYNGKGYETLAEAIEDLTTTYYSTDDAVIYVNHGKHVWGVGTYIENEHLTIECASRNVVINVKDGFYLVNGIIKNATVHFESSTIQDMTSDSFEFDNCAISGITNGLDAGALTFKNCDFTASDGEYCSKLSCNTLLLDKCKFNIGKGKGLLIEPGSDKAAYTVTGCTFAAEQDLGEAAIELYGEFKYGGTLTIDGTTTCSGLAKGLWAESGYNDNGPCLTVVVDNNTKQTGH